MSEASNVYLVVTPDMSLDVKVGDLYEGKRVVAQRDRNPRLADAPPGSYVLVMSNDD